jgi:hypothetical protein
MSNNVQTSSNSFFSSLSKGFEAVGDAAQGVAAAAIDYATDTVEDVTDGLEKIADGELAAGALELADAISIGSTTARQLQAVGIIPDSEAAKELTSGLVNAVLMNPIAIKDGFDFLAAQKSASANPRTGKPMAAAHAPPCRPSEQLARCGGKGRGYAAPKAGGGACSSAEVMKRFEGSFTPADALRRAFEGAVRDAGIRRDGAPVADKPLASRKLHDILNDPSLCFEDMVAMFMAQVVHDEQQKIAGELKKYAGLVQKAEAKKTAARAAKASGSDKSGGLGGLVDVFAAGASGAGNDADTLKSVIGFARMALPVLAPALSAAAMAVPPIGPVLAPLMPFILPVVLDVAESSLGGASGAQAKSKKGASAQASATGGAGEAKADDADDTKESRQLMFERIKMMQQRMQQMLQCMSNVLNVTHQGAMNAVRNIR